MCCMWCLALESSVTSSSRLSLGRCRWPSYVQWCCVSPGEYKHTPQHYITHVVLLRRKAEGSYLLCRSHTLTALYRVRGPASRSLFTLCERSLLKDKCVIVKSKSLVALNTSPIYCNTHQKSMIQIIAVENCLMNTTDAEACMKYSFTNVKIFTITRCFYSKSSEKLVFSFQALF